MKEYKNEYTLNEYDCGYCGYVFRQYVRKIGSRDALGYRQNPMVSSQVKCPHCENFLRTWEDGKEIEVVKVSGAFRGRLVV